MYIYPTITINGVSSKTIAGLLITSLPPISKPLQRTLVDVIDGRAGDVVTPLGFAAYDKPVGIALTKDYDVNEVIAFFNSSGVVTFSNEPDKYYNFAIYEQIDFERLIRFKTATVVFHVQPYKYANNENPLNFAITSGEPVSVNNSGNTDSKPDLMITGEGVVDLDINGEQLLSIDFGEDEQAYIIDSDAMNAYAVENAIKDVKADFLASQAEGTPTPAAPIPIVGVDKVNVTRTGKNLCGGSKFLSNAQAYLPSGTTDLDNKTFRYATTTTATSGLSFTSGIKFKENTAYTFILSIIGTTGYSNLQVVYTDNTTANIPNPSESNTKEVIRFVSNANKTVKYLRRRTAGGSTIIYYEESGIFEGNILTADYEPYNGTTALINLGGTYYGGEVDAVTGKITLTHGVYTFDGTEAWGLVHNTSPQTFDYFRLYGSPFTNKISNFSTSHQSTLLTSYPITDSLNYWYSGGLNGDINAWTVKNYAGLCIRNDGYSDADTFANSLSGQILVYELETPLIVYASNTAELQAVLGVNNIFSDAGDVEVTYKAGGVIHTETGEIVTFTLTPEDYERGAFVNRQIVGNYDNIKLKSGANSISLTGNATSLTVDKYSRWI